MPSSKPTPVKQKRVRTGCWTCRRRRRKCDERKPRCENCEAKGFSCRYGADLTFVPVPNPTTQSTNGPATRAANYNAIQFIDDRPATSDITLNCGPFANGQGTSTSTIPGASATQSSIVEQDVELATADHADAEEFNRPAYLSGVDADISRASTFSDSSTASQLPDNSRTVAKSRSLAYFSGHRCSSSRLPITSNPTYPIPASGADEIGLLRYFRYHLAPWIDVGDPECGFEIHALLLAKTSRPLLAAIMALALTHSSLQQNNNAIGVNVTLQQEAERGLAHADDPIKSMGQALLMLHDFLFSHPRQWRDFLRARTRGLSTLDFARTPQGVLNQPWWLLHSRIDLAAGIISAKAPLMSYRSQLLLDGPFPLVPQQRPAKWVFLRVLFLLADTLSLLFSPSDTLSSSSERGGQLAVHTLLQTDFTSRWTSIWTSCHEWYHTRHVEMRPILDISGVEADEINSGNCSSFPILIYTSALALLANTIYHISSFLLLIHKPRLLKTLPGPKRFISRIWHAQAIAGIATSNEFKEQWDPILIASLLTVAPEMTHKSQQSILLNLLGSITTVTGIKLDSEIDDLRCGWNISQYDEEAVD
ncbi:hypothetical protein F9C07_1181719 [Aspergillus flavus]|uniref:Zn(2)-C6 fungal-type domain-containing protein n=3 Tax=Aspergillus subgen. Circumdati TaxID=2720871 RepID=A0A7U2QRA8_ASPFN|nr:hypothetical protein AFLA_012363 [Aspergillus flavus NRRL3357]KOC16630.1 hypothetical protein AFLA70_656g000421 [Aspergillus flavus AF70]QRD81417.1 hypothetical protein F9C07_1181719 [Aspergillus flavus]RAQ40862.1 hypothetical protein AFGD_007224 [Aspergillus flavus]RMZ39518.1 hypothetical protein CA14_010164 [Aspergillus flavus]